ncbi:AAA+-type ATPase [Trachipleistophora hominis]|uniref:AAA+-type ATPase n=1 Tax=Trachipleistophora hominis TaxID=72359 RepID=L7JVC2_TRAHO|nr:AAA+-type ATPase [Trachipleistophora hominis]
MDKAHIKTKRPDDKDLKTLYFVKSSRNEMLNRDITVDVLTYLVGYNLFQKPKDKKKGKGIFLKVIIIGAIIVCLIGVMYKIISKKKMQDAYKTINDPTVFSATNYFGKENIMETLVGRITRIINLIEKKNKKLLNSKMTAAKKNILLYGEPGTGKTLLVKKMAFLLDQNLKLLKLKKSKIDIQKMKKSDLLAKLKRMKPCVRLIAVQPSSLNDRYVGGTEKNIQKLWDFATKNKKHVITIVFMDEIDSFFSKRKEENSEHSSNVKSEFLCILDGLRSKLTDRLIFIGATNLPKTLDEAFLRRFHTKILFSKPSLDEIRLLIESFLTYNEYRLSDVEINELVNACNGLTQSQIARIFSDAADYSDTLTYYADFNDIMILLNNIKSAGNNIEAELAEIHVEPRGTEEDFVLYNNLIS